MYQVIEIYGDFEPWWFLEDWKDDIVSETTFSTFKEAHAFYTKKWEEFKKSFPSFQSRSDFMAAFWDDKEKRWCVDCDEDIQLYHSLLLLKDDKEIPETLHDKKFNLGNQVTTPPTCSLNF